MNKEKIKKKHNILIYLGIFVAVALVLTAIFRVLTPPEEKIVESDFVIKNYDQSETRFKKVEFTGSEIIVPEKLKILKPIEGKHDADSLAIELRKEYQLNQHPSRDNYWLSENHTLIKRSSENEYVLYDNISPVDSTENQSLNLEKAIKTCSYFLKKYEINIDLLAQEDFIAYLGGGIQPQEVPEEEAVEVQIPFTQEVFSYPLFYKNEKEFPFYCAVDRNNKIKDFIFKDFFYAFEEIKELDSISIAKAVSNINKGKASIISAESNFTEILDLNWINEANLYEVSIDYRYDDELKVAYPFYHFKANITNSNGINIKADIITPAVASEREK